MRPSGGGVEEYVGRSTLQIATVLVSRRSTPELAFGRSFREVLTILRQRHVRAMRENINSVGAMRAVASRNYPTLAFKSHNVAPIGPAFDGTNGEYLNGVALVRRYLLQFCLSIHLLQWPSWELSMFILRIANTHILAHRPLRVVAMRARRAVTRNAASRRELPRAAASLARRRCMIPCCPDTMKARNRIRRAI